VIITAAWLISSQADNRAKRGSDEPPVCLICLCAIFRFRLGKEGRKPWIGEGRIDYDSVVLLIDLDVTLCSDSLEQTRR
jgi:hypothetical protein